MREEGEKRRGGIRVRVRVMFTNSDPSYVTARVWLQLGSGYRLDF